MAPRRSSPPVVMRAPLHAPLVVSHHQSLARRPPAALSTHDHAVLALHTAEATVELRGQWSLAPGDLLLIPAGEPHRMLGTPHVDCWGLAFCPPCFAAHLPPTLLEPLDRVRSGASPVVRIPADRRPFLTSLFQELERTQASRPVVEVVQRSLLTLLLQEVVEASGAESPHVEASGVAAGGLLAEALRFIELHCLEPISLREVAAAVRRSPGHVTTALKQGTGRGVVGWITAGRMAEARRRLLHSDEQVEVIGERVGYADSTHFIRTFRRAHGLTPAAWRRAHTSGK